MRNVVLLALAAAAAPFAPASAAETGSGLSLTGSAALVSDYRFRGISLSDEDPALQGALEVGHASGLYGGLWASSLHDTPLYGALELDLNAGWRGKLAPGTSIDLGVTYYFYPDGKRSAGPSDYWEPHASLTQTLGPVDATAGIAYAPGQDAIGGRDNLYLWTGLSAAVPGTPLTLKGQAGWSDGSLAPGGRYWDWSVGAEAALGPVKLGLAYVDTDLGNIHDVDPGIVASLSFGF